MVHPQLRKIVRVVGQPSFVQSYERTSIYPKVTAFIEKWNVDIGDKVQKGDVLADLFVPELREHWGTKKATVEYDKERVRLAQKDVEVAAAEVKAAQARLDEAKAILGKYRGRGRALGRPGQAARARSRAAGRRPPDPPGVAERVEGGHRRAGRRQGGDREGGSGAAWPPKPDWRRAEVNVAVARAELGVAESEAKRLEAWVGYLKLFAPYDGIIVARNANTWDFVLPTTGDPTAKIRAPDLSPSEQAAPIYVVDRTDIVRIYVDIPERDANYVHIGSEARVKLWAYRDEWLPASVTRLSWALNTKSRTMRAEIDLPNPGSQILPGMYAYGEVVVERPDVRALPKSALTLCRREVLHLAVRERPRGAHRDPDGSRPTASGSRSPIAASSGSQGRRTVGADRRVGTGAHRPEAVDPHRRCSGAAGELSGAGRGRIGKFDASSAKHRLDEWYSPGKRAGQKCKKRWRITLMAQQDDNKNEEQQESQASPGEQPAKGGGGEGDRAAERSLQSNMSDPDRTMVVETSRIRRPSESGNPNFVVVPVEFHRPQPSGSGEGKGGKKPGEGGEQKSKGQAGDGKKDKSDSKAADSKNQDQEQQAGQGQQKGSKWTSPSLTKTLLLAGAVAFVAGIVGAWGFSYLFGSSSSGDQSSAGKGGGSSKGGGGGSGKGGGGSGKSSKSGKSSNPGATPATAKTRARKARIPTTAARPRTRSTRRSSSRPRWPGSMR